MKVKLNMWDFEGSSKNSVYTARKGKRHFKFQQPFARDKAMVSLKYEAEETRRDD